MVYTSIALFVSLGVSHAVCSLSLYVDGVRLHMVTTYIPRVDAWKLMSCAVGVCSVFGNGTRAACLKGGGEWGCIVFVSNINVSQRSTTLW